jgi:hypothetical protein
MMINLWNAPSDLFCWVVRQFFWRRTIRQIGRNHIFVNGRIADWFWRRKWYGVTLGRSLTVHWHYSLGHHEAHIRHEEHHQAQAEKMGPLYLPVWLLLTVCFGYWDNPMEVDARISEGEPY